MFKCIGEAIIQKKFNLIFLLRSCFGFFSAFFCVSSKFFLSFFVREKKGGHTMSTHNTQFTFTRCRSICWFFMIFFFISMSVLAFFFLFAIFKLSCMCKTHCLNDFFCQVEKKNRCPVHKSLCVYFEGVQLYAKRNDFN